MTKPKRSRGRRPGSPLQPAAPPGDRVGVRQSKRASSRRENFDVWFEIGAASSEGNRAQPATPTRGNRMA
jgi:hypothetical protein